MSSHRDDCDLTLESIADDGSTRARFTGPPSLAVCNLLAVITGTNPEDLPPLYDAVDPDALNRLFDRGQPPERAGDVAVEFQYGGYALRIHSYGIIEAEPLSSE